MNARTRRLHPIRRTLGVITAVVVLVSAQGAALAGSRDGFTAEPGRQLAQHSPVSLAMLTPLPGAELRFVQIDDVDGNTTGIGIIETLGPGMASLLGLEDLSGANPLEIFIAYAREGTQVPSEMLDLYDDLDTARQGWAIEKIEKHSGSESNFVSFTFPEEGKTYPRHAGCKVRVGAYPQTWAAPLEYGLSEYPDHYIAANTGPLVDPTAWTSVPAPLPVTEGGPYFRFAGQANSVTGFSASIILCDTAHFYSYDGQVVGKDVVLYSRPANAGGGNVWQSVQELGKLDAVDKVIAFQFHPAQADSPLAPRFDFRLEIQAASGATNGAGTGKSGDRFYIGATWLEMTDSEFAR